ncbi:ead/Ea22-like family protein [Citrobacter freundii]|uniref:ead/Ea22-like family protein n=1 Tax=Citrobacter freundii TaxID=546 RepID=UPI0040416670
MTALNKQALRADALEATGGSWVRESGEGWEAICCDDDQGNAGFIIAEFQGENATANRKFVQSANPATVLALLDELEAAEKRIAELEARKVTLPDERFRYGESDYDDGYVNGWNAHGIETKSALRAAGIGVKGE